MFPFINILIPKTPRLIFLKMTSSNSQSTRGALIVFEGLDRSGKSTQSQMLVESLNKVSKQSQHMCFPDRTTPIGKILGQYLSRNDYVLNDRAIHLLFTANRFENATKIKELLCSGVNVIVDRYSFSGIVYSAVKKGMPIEWCIIPESGLPEPDVVIFLKISLEEMRLRSGFGNERYENQITQEKVAQEYEKLSKKFDFFEVNGNDSMENINRIIVDKTLNVIKDVEHSEVKYFNFLK